MSLSVKLEVFEGPLDLLLHLIDKNKVDIYDIPIIEITRQYLEYINNMEYKDLDSMSKFLVMASELINIKSKMLLPKDQDADEEDPRYELVERLLEYKMIKYASDILKNREQDASKTLYKDETIPDEVKEYEEEIDPSQVLADISLIDIHKIFLSIIKKQEDKIDPIRSKFGEIQRDKISVSDKIADIKKYASIHREFSFTELLSGQVSKSELIVTFLGVLELTKNGQVIIRQSILFDDFIITRTDKKIPNEEEMDDIMEAGINGN